MTLATIHAEHVYPHPPARVWDALTDPAKVSRWLMPTDLRAEPGARFTFDAGPWGTVQGEALEVEPGRRFRFAWRNPPFETFVTFTVAPEGDGSRVTFEHGTFDLDDPQHRMAHDGLKGGWTGIVGQRLGTVLDEG